jgi:hypothetical protein
MQKGPYFNPVQYISPLPEGYMQASTNIANTLGKAAQGLGQTIASSIEQYTKNKEEGQFLDEKFQMTTGNLEKYKTDPKFAEDPRAKKLAEGVGKFSAMSNSQKKSFLNNADFAVSQFDREAAIDYAKAQAQRQYELDAQKALIDAATFRSNEAVNAARIEDLRRGFEPTAKTVTLPDGTVVPLVSTGKNQFQVVSKPAASGPESPGGKELADYQAAVARGDTAGAEFLLARMNAAKKETPKLEVSDKTFMSNATEYMQQLTDLENIVKTYGNVEVNIPAVSSEKSTAASAKLQQLPYKMAITYSKIVDPSSVAREGEVAAAQKYLIPAGLTVSNDVTLAAIKNQREEIKRRITQFNELNAEKLGSNKIVIPKDETSKAAQGPTKFESMADAEAARASGFTGVAEIFDPVTGKYRKALIN